MDSEQVKREAVLGIDPGPYESAYCFVEDGLPVQAAKVANVELLLKLRFGTGYNFALADYAVVIETIFPRGQSVGIETMNTQLWAGRFWEAAEYRGCRVHSIDRQDVRFAICGSLDTRDSSVRQGLIDHYGGDAAARSGQKCHGCKGRKRRRGRITCGECRDGTIAGGTRKCPKCRGRGDRSATVDCDICRATGWLQPPGPLRNFAKDMWAALSIALAWKLRTEMRAATLDRQSASDKITGAGGGTPASLNTAKL